VFIGDIKTPVKHASPELKQMIAHVEEKMMEKFILEEIPSEFQPIFFERMKEGKDASIEGRLLEFADKLDQFYEYRYRVCINVSRSLDEVAESSITSKCGLFPRCHARRCET
jgi:5'-deoxynucleotidase YfbR-like HD superfamily hydrolase